MGRCPANYFTAWIQRKKIGKRFGMGSCLDSIVPGVCPCCKMKGTYQGLEEEVPSVPSVLNVIGIIAVDQL